MAVEFDRLNITSGYNTNKINTNFERVDTALQDSLSRSGNGPNQMNADIDLNGNDLLNVASLQSDELIVDGVNIGTRIDAALQAATEAEASADSAEEDASSAAASALAASLSADLADNRRDYASVAAVEGSNTPGSILYLRTAGYYTEGDGGGALYKRSETEPTHSGKIQSTDGAWWELAPDITINTAVFGARRDGVTDDRQAIINADAFCAAKGLTLWIVGPHVSSDGINQTANWEGISPPQLAPFPLTGDHKNFLRPGYKHLIPGSSIRFVGTGTQSVQTQRSDDFADVTYCVRMAKVGLKKRNVGIILDTDVYDVDGNFTAFGADNSANYDIGNFVDNAAQVENDNVVVWGYYAVSGTATRTLGGVGVDNPDYNIWRGGSTMGKRGFSLVGSEGADAFAAGLSGTQTYGLDIFSNDHHSRSPTNAPAIYANANTWRNIYIDGYTGASSANINGHYFFGGNIRTYAIHPVELDAASQVSLSQITIETSNYAGVPYAATKQFLASSETYNVSLYSCRLATSYGLLDPEFGGVINGQLVISHCPGSGYGGGIIVSEASGGVANWVKVGGGSGGTGDPAIQFGQGSGSSSTTGWSFRRDISANDVLNFVWDGTTVFNIDTTGAIGRLALRIGTLTISGGVVTVGSLSYYNIATEASAATDDLDTINGGVDGQILILKSVSATRDVNITEVGNIRLSAPFILSHTQDRITLQYDGTGWNELSRSDNTA